MSQDIFPPLPSTGKVAEEVQDAPVDGQRIPLSLTKDVELRIQSDKELRGAIEELISEVREIKELLQQVLSQ